MEIRKVPISLLNAAPYNPRKDLQPGDPEYQKIARRSKSTAVLSLSSGTRRRAT